MFFKRLQDLLKHWRRPHKPSAVEVKRQRHLGEKFEETMMAVAFAEAGAQEEALDLLQRRGKRKILVLGQDETFSDAVLDYATLLAERLGYELVALNVGTPAGKLLSPFGKHMQEEFRQQAQAAAAVLEQKAAQKNIPCTHVVKFGDVAKAVEEINREYRRIELVITDSPSKREELHARVNLPVFSLKTHR
jgi:hypothetical protein